MHDSPIVDGCDLEEAGKGNLAAYKEERQGTIDSIGHKP